MITDSVVQSTTITNWMRESATVVSDQCDYLTQLDSAIGDGDHGLNMRRGFDSVTKALAGQEDSLPPGRLLIVAGKTLVSTIGGASGPLWGTALRRAGRALGDRGELEGEDLAAALDAALAGVVDLGAASPGDKTMVDALAPAVDALRHAIEAERPVPVALGAAAAAAEEGMRATIPMQARKGRASYLGERSVGHQDPGATSTALIIRALEAAVAAEG
jgi:phosphoenolpyruvate---glycerone phosphotransferase subunit DhaL